tara:strand:- start:105 stop:320 length:216 start_codon:yes stop_codon:yes gene_type:complete
MVRIVDSQGSAESKPVFETVVVFDNFKLTLLQGGDVKIQTKGEWKGDLQDLYVIIDTAVTQAGWKDGEAKQ